MVSGNAIRLIVFILAGIPTLSWGLPAFPGAEGYGADTTHGRGGSICTVTNLNDSGSGSLRNCLAVATGTRIVIFRVGGTIQLSSMIQILSANSNVYIAGQTAPGGGIQVRNNTVRLTGGAHDIVIRHLRFRHGGDTSGRDSLSLTGSNPPSNVVVDHSTIMWGTDENLEIIGAYNTTIQWSIMAEGGPKPPYASAGTLANDDFLSTSLTQTVSLHHNLYAQNDVRNPVWNFQNRANPAPLGIIDIRNNVVARWGQFGMQFNMYHSSSDPVGSTNSTNQPHFNLINNYFKPGSTASNHAYIVFGLGLYGQFYLSGNWSTDNCPTGCSGGQSQWDFSDVTSAAGNDPGNASKEANHTSATEFTVPAVTTTPTSQLFDLVMDNVGATKPERDSVDERIISETIAGTGVVGPSDDGTNDWPTLASGTAYTDTDGDGMSDTWETTCNGTLGTLNPNSASDGDDIISGVDASVNGYSQVEVFINAMAGDYGPDGLTTCAGLLDDTPPSTPTMNSPSVVSDSQINTSWSAATDAESGISGYELQYCTGSSCTPSTTITLGNVTSYNHTSLSPSTVYGYRVRAVNGAALAGSYSSPTGYATTNSATPDITTGLVSRWPLDGNTNDVIGSYDGTLQNFPGDPSGNWVSGQIGGGLDFDGSNDYLSLGDINEIDGADELTISAWVKFDTLQDYSTIFLKGSGNTATGMQTGATGDGDGNNDPYLIVQDGSFSWGWTTGNLLTTGSWHHWAMVFDGAGSGNANRIKFYFDGDPQTLTFSGTIPALTDANAISARLSDTSGPFNGVLDEVRLYSRALSSIDVDALYELDDTVIILGNPSSLNTTETGTTTFVGNPLSLNTTETGTTAVLGNPTSLSTAESGTTVFLSNPASLGAL